MLWKEWHEGRETRLNSSFLSFGKKGSIIPRGVTGCTSGIVYETRSGLNSYRGELQRWSLFDIFRRQILLSFDVFLNTGLVSRVKKSQICGGYSQLHFLSSRDTRRGIGSLHLPLTCMCPSLFLCTALGCLYFSKFVPSCFIFLIPCLVSQSLQRLKCKHLICLAATSIVKFRASLNTQLFLPQFVPLSWQFQIPDARDTTSWDSKGKKERTSSSPDVLQLTIAWSFQQWSTRTWETALQQGHSPSAWRASKRK